jgi:hypothetical protein
VAHITIKDEGQDIVKDLCVERGYRHQRQTARRWRETGPRWSQSPFSTQKMGVAIAEEWRYDPNDLNAPWTSSFTPDPNDPNGLRPAWIAKLCVY